MDVFEIISTKYEQDYLRGNITFKEENDRAGIVIDRWDMPIPRPTRAEIASYEAEVLPIFTLNKLKKDIITAIEMRLDRVAKSKTYKDAISCTTYFSSTNAQWRAEATAFVAWRDAVWTYSINEYEKAKLGTRPFVTVEEFMAELPTIVW